MFQKQNAVAGSLFLVTNYFKPKQSQIAGVLNSYER